MNQPPLNPDAIRELTEAIRLTVEYVGTGMLPAIPGWSWYDAMVKYAPNDAEVLRAMDPLPEPAAALPEVTGEQVNLAGWTCNGIHEPGDYSTCEECRDACDDLARFYNHMMRNPRPFKHWTGHPEVKP